MPEFEDVSMVAVAGGATASHAEPAPGCSNGVAAPPDQEALLPAPQTPAKEEKCGREAAESDTLCGLGRWTPAWLQPLASKKAYVLLHGLIGMNTFALGSYFVATISTLEKRFKIPSRTSGLISSAWDIGTMVTLLALSYLGSRGHKPRWIAACTLLVALSCLLRVLPHLLYGPGQDALLLTLEYGAAGANTSLALANASAASAAAAVTAVCGSAPDTEDCSAGGGASSAPSAIFFISHVVLGAGNSLYFTLGLAYMDDNTRKDKAPILLAVSQCLRMLGPTFGFVVASYALRLYVAPGLTPVIDNDDPRWIGAWWLAWVPFGCVAVVLSGVLVMFPRQLPRTAQRRADAGHQTVAGDVAKISFADFRCAFSRLIHNPVLLFNTFSGVCFMFGVIGYWIFMPKYMETQFRQSAATASLISGSVGLVFTALGLITSALVISRWKPRPRVLAAWNVGVELIDVVGQLCLAFISCPSDNLQGSWGHDNTWNMTLECNADCGCGPHVKYAPVCAEGGGATFYSACHAGCETSFINGSTTVYGGCACIPGSGRAVEGACTVDCAASFGLFLALQCFMSFVSSTGRAGNTIIQFRCVDEADKPLAIAFAEVLMCGLAFIPGPIIYGLLLDYACVVWGETCGQSGNCWLYDGTTLRYLLNFFAAGFLLCGTVLDAGVWYYVRDLRIYDDDEAADGVGPGGAPCPAALGRRCSRAVSFSRALADEPELPPAIHRPRRYSAQ
ncbi:solute carrier organic anion transporter family member 74D-like [Schistocerca americana]|uniref:solute carrier organic anion transporter family member 74D-like n=1 Tax=Schistocerca americana TaxID=7009 RepID=UPI001F4FCAD2|nr:solute carrier organic anion transporter family member 74D-like [Schistocerca americana]